MKRLLFILLCICLAGSSSYGQSGCCHPDANSQFAIMASNEKFAAAHDDPLPFDFVPVSGTSITYPTDDGKQANAFEVKADQPTDNWMIVVHEWWGLNSYMKNEAEKLHSELPKTNVLAVDLYDGKVAETKEDAQKFVGAMNKERTISILKGAIAHAGPKAKIYTIGWCMGGGWALQAELIAGKQGGGCVMYYGMPETDRAKLKPLSGDVLGIFGKQDEWINEKVVNKFSEDMKATGKKLYVKWYDADHAFANPSNPKYNKPAAADAKNQTLGFFRERIK